MAKAESSKAASNGIRANASAAQSGNYDLPWWVDGLKLQQFILFTKAFLSHRIEKYRPYVLNDIVGNTETIERLKIIARDGNMPHLIISGMPGIGKTTSILCLARQLLGDAYREAVLELNASDERGQDEFHISYTSSESFMTNYFSFKKTGIDVVRNRIKAFAQKKVTLPPGRHKLVILDEADRYVVTAAIFFTLWQSFSYSK